MRGVFLCFGGQKKLRKYFKNILATALKSYIKWLLYTYIYIFLKKFEKVEKTVFWAKFFLHCTLSLTLGFRVNFWHKKMTFK